MKNKNYFNGIRDGAMMTALCVIFMLLAMYMPFFSFIGMFMSGIPIAALYARDGFKFAVLGIICSMIITMILTANVMGVISLTIAYTLPGLIAGICMKKKFSFSNSVIYTSAAFLFGLIVQILMIKLFMGGIDVIFNEAFAMFEKTFAEVLNTLSDPQLKNSMNVEITAIVETMKRTFKLYFPSIIIITSLVYAYFTYVLTGFILKRIRVLNVHIVPFYMLRAPKSMCSAAIVLYLIKLFITSGSLVDAALSNIILVIYMVLAICGFSFIDFKFKKVINKGIIRTLIYLMIFVFGGMIGSIIFSVFVIIGMLDSSMNYRRISSVDNDDMR